MSDVGVRFALLCLFGCLPINSLSNLSSPQGKIPGSTNEKLTNQQRVNPSPLGKIQVSTDEKLANQQRAKPSLQNKIRFSTDEKLANQQRAKPSLQNKIRFSTNEKLANQQRANPSPRNKIRFSTDEKLANQQRVNPSPQNKIQVSSDENLNLRKISRGKKKSPAALARDRSRRKKFWKAINMIKQCKKSKPLTAWVEETGEEVDQSDLYQPSSSSGVKVPYYQRRYYY